MKQAEGRARSIKRDLAHVEATIRLFKADWDRTAVAPLRPKVRSRWAGKGRASQAALAVLRAADQPLSAREIAVRIMEAKGIDATDARAVQEVASGVHGALKRRLGNGVVAHDGFPRLWAIG